MAGNLNDIQLNIIVKGMGVDQLQQAANSISKVGAAVQESAKQAATAQSSWSQFLSAMNELERKFDAVFRAASHLQALGADLTGIGKAGLGMLKDQVDTWGDFEYELNRAAGALGIFDTMTPIYKDLQNGINKVAQEARLFPAEDVAHAVYLWGSATGQVVKSQSDLDKVMSGVLPIMKVAGITNTDLEKAMKGVYQISLQYGLGLDSVGDITAKLFKLTQKTSLEFPDLIEAFKYTGAIAPSLGVKFEDLAIIMARLGDLGIRGSQSGRGLGQMFSKLVQPTAQAKKALDKVFLSNEKLKGTFDSLVFPEGKFVGITKYMDLLATATEDMTDQEKNHLIAMISTQNEMRVLLPLLNDTIKSRREGVDALQAEKTELDDAAQIMEKSFDLIRDSWKGMTGYLANSLAPITQLIGAATANMARPFIDWMAKMLQSLRAFLDAHPEIVDFGVKLVALVSIAAAVAGAFFTFIGVALALGAGIAFVAQAAGKAIFGFDQLVNVVDDGGKVIGQRVEFVKGIFSRFIPDLQKWGGIIAIVFGAIINNVGGIRDSISNFVEAAINFLSKLKLNFGLILGPVQTVYKVIETLLTPAFFALSKILDFVAGLLNGFAKDKGAIDAFSSLGNAVLLAVGAFIAYKSTMALVAGVQALYNAALVAGSAIMTVFTTGVKIATATWKLLDLAMRSSLIGVIISAIILAVGLLYEAWQNNWFGMRDVIANVFDTIAEIAGNIVSTLIGVAKNVAGVAAAIPGPWQEGAKALQATLAKMQADVDGWGEGVNNDTAIVSHATSERLDQMNAAFEKSPMPRTARALTEGTTREMKLAWEAGMDPIAQAAYLAATREQQAIIDARAAKEKDIKTEADIAAAILPNRLKAFKKVASKASTDMMAGIIQSIYDNFDALDTAWNQYLDHLAKPLDTATEMAKIKSRLASSELQKGLASKNPIIRADAENMRKSLEAQLLALQNNAPEYAMKTGQNYADAMADQQINAKAAAVTMVSGAKIHMRDSKIDAATSGSAAGASYGSSLAGKQGQIKKDATTALSGAGIVFSGWRSKTWTWGYNAGTAFANALASAGAVLQQQSANFLNHAKTILQFSSPPEGGPWKNIDKWGFNAGTAFSDGILNARRYLVNSAQTFLSSADDVLSSNPLVDKIANGGDMSFDADITRHIVIDAHVSSPDGTVNNAARSTLEDIFGSEEFVSTLEHMATVG